MKLLILRPVCIQKVYGAAPDIHLPGLKVHPSEIDLHLAQQPFTRFVQNRFQRQGVWIQRHIVFRLPVFPIDRLLKIALPVKQADPYKTKAKIAGRARMISRKNAQPSGGDGQRLVKTIFGSEICHRVSYQGGCVSGCPHIFPVHVGIEGCQDAPDPPGKNRILQAHVQLILGNVLKNGDSVVIKVLPAAGREFLKYILALLVPGPP